MQWLTNLHTVPSIETKKINIFRLKTVIPQTSIDVPKCWNKYTKLNGPHYTTNALESVSAAMTNNLNRLKSDRNTWMVPNF